MEIRILPSMPIDFLCLMAFGKPIQGDREDKHMAGCCLPRSLPYRSLRSTVRYRLDDDKRRDRAFLCVIALRREYTKFGISYGFNRAAWGEGHVLWNLHFLRCYRGLWSGRLSELRMRFLPISRMAMANSASLMRPISGAWFCFFSGHIDVGNAAGPVGNSWAG